MHFTLFSIPFLLATATFVHSAPAAVSLDAVTLRKNAQEAQQLNVQFQSSNSTACSCTNGDTTCIQGAIATCVNGQFDTSQGRCPATESCFALPSVNSTGTVITCTSEKSAQNLINAAGATGDATGSGSGGSTSSVKSSVSSTSSSSKGGSTTTAETATPTSSKSAVTVTVTLSAMVTTTLPSVTQTLSPEEASNFLASIFAQASQTVNSTASAMATDSPTATPDTLSTESLNSTSSATIIPSSALPTITFLSITASTASPTSSGSGQYGGY